MLQSQIESRLQEGPATLFWALECGIEPSPSEYIPETTIIIHTTFTHFGFETLRTTPQNLLKMETFYRGILRRMQNLPDETASCALHILLGTLPLEAHLDTQVLSLFARLLHLPDLIEQEILCRQLSMKDIDSASWTQKV